MSSFSEKPQMRKKLYVKPGFQKKMMIIIILVVAISVNLVGGLCFGLITGTLEEEFLTQTMHFSGVGETAILKQKLFEYMFPKILMAEFIAILVVGILSLRISHHIAGPVYRLEKNMTEMARENIFIHTAFRNRDEFTELAEALNQLGYSWQKRLENIEEQLALLDYTELTAEQKAVIAKMKEMLEIKDASSLVEQNSETEQV